MTLHLLYRLKARSFTPDTLVTLTDIAANAYPLRAWLKFRTITTHTRESVADLSRNCKGFRASESVHTRVTESHAQGTGVGRDIRQSPSRVRSVFLLIYAARAPASAKNRGRQPFLARATTLWVLLFCVTCVEYYAPDSAQDEQHHAILQSRVNEVMVATTNWAAILRVLWQGIKKQGKRLSLFNLFRTLCALLRSRSNAHCVRYYGRVVHRVLGASCVVVMERRI